MSVERTVKVVLVGDTSKLAEALRPKPRPLSPAAQFARSMARVRQLVNASSNELEKYRKRLLELAGEDE